LIVALRKKVKSVSPGEPVTAILAVANTATPTKVKKSS
jgi:hypothetical protein